MCRMLLTGLQIGLHVWRRLIARKDGDTLIRLFLYGLKDHGSLNPMEWDRIGVALDVFHSQDAPYKEERRR